MKEKEEETKRWRGLSGGFMDLKVFSSLYIVFVFIIYYDIYYPLYPLFSTDFGKNWMNASLSILM